MARKPTGSSTASQESTPHLDDKSADEPEARARPSASDPDNVPETLCDGGFNIWSTTTTRRFLHASSTEGRPPPW